MCAVASAPGAGQRPSVGAFGRLLSGRRAPYVQGGGRHGPRPRRQTPLMSAIPSEGTRDLRGGGSGMLAPRRAGPRPNWQMPEHRASSCERMGDRYGPP
jgi:hypothetical protein